MEKFRKLAHKDTENFCAKYGVSTAFDGYMPPEEFRIEAKASLTKILNERGIISRQARIDLDNIVIGLLD